MLGLPATTGLATIDYRLTDPYLDPPGATDDDYTEQSIRLPHCFWCYQPGATTPPVGALPARDERLRHLRLPEPVRQGHPAGPGALGADPPGRRRLAPGPARAGRAVTATTSASCFRQGGIAADRVEFVAKVPLFRLSRALSRARPLPRSVPLQRRHHHARRPLDGRAGHHPGRPHGGGPRRREHPVERRPDRADRPDARAVRRTSPSPGPAIEPGWPRFARGLRQRMQASPLMDGKQYAADVEAAFRGMWKSWCGP